MKMKLHRIRRTTVSEFICLAEDQDTALSMFNEDKGVTQMGFTSTIEIETDQERDRVWQEERKL